MANTIGERREGLAFIEIRDMDDVTGRAEFTGEGQAPRRQPLCMMEEQNLSDRGTLAQRRRRCLCVSVDRERGTMFGDKRRSAS
jgi:hypothetical protein